jgi:predicted sulfurtransferase
MEVRSENGWTGKGWVFDPRTLGRFKESDATIRHLVPAVDVIEDNCHVCREHFADLRIGSCA